MIPKNLKEVRSMQYDLDSKINNIRKRKLGDMCRSLVAELIELDEELATSHKTWKKAELVREKQLTELVDCYFFVSQIMNYYDLKFEQCEIEQENTNNNLDVLIESAIYYAVCYDVAKVCKRLNQIMFLLKFTAEEVFAMYAKKWEINMKRIGAEWN